MTVFPVMKETAPTVDLKMFIDRKGNPAFAEQMAARVNEGHIMPFSILFAECHHAYLDTDEKSDHDIVQFGFLVTDGEGKILLTRRIGHKITKGPSVLVNWSPSHPPGATYPQSDDHILWAYQKEIDNNRLDDPSLHFLGLVMNIVDGVRFYFYLFNVSYNSLAPHIFRLEKERSDNVLGFHEIDRDLLDHIKDKRVDICALHFLRPNLVGRPEFPECIAISHDGLHSPPHLISPPDVFISHSKKDDQLSNEVEQVLKEAGITFWADHASLKPGHSWFSEIRAGVKYCRLFVILCTRNAIEALGVLDEVNLVVKRIGRDPFCPVIPLVFEGEAIESLIPHELRRFQAMDFRNAEERTASLRILVERIREALPKQLATTAQANQRRKVLGN